MSATVSSQQGKQNLPGGVDLGLSLAAELYDVGGQIAAKADKAATYGGNSIRYLAAHQAFRLNSLLDSAPQVNRIGTMTGMVISKEWRHIYQLTVKYQAAAKKLRPVADFMAWGTYIAGWGAEINRAYNSHESWDAKGQRLCFYATTAMVQTRSGTAHGITDLAIATVEASCKLGARLGVPGSTTCASYADIASTSVAVYYKTIEDATTPDSIRSAVIDRGGDVIAALDGWYDDSVRVIRYYLK